MYLVLRLQSDTAKLASRTMQLNQEKTMKQTTLLADPRMLAKARGKAGPGARGNSARGPRNAVQRAAEETRQWVLQRKQAIASASKPPTKIDVPPKGSQDAIRNRVIKAPANKIRQKPALDGVRDKKQDKAQMPSATPSSAGLTNSGDANQSAASTAPLLMTPKKPAPARTGGGMFAGSKLWVAKGMPPTETKKITRHSNGTVTISASIDWTEPRNKQILESYTPAEKAAALSKPATTATVPAAEYKKRGSNAISSDDNDTTSVSSSAASPSVDGDNTRPLAPIKRRKVAPSLFMSPKTTARPRTQD